MPPVLPSVSSQSRRKLKAFEFQPEEHDIGNKENHKDTTHMNKFIAADDDDDGTTTKSLPISTAVGINPPRTPGRRIPFSDLIANPEDALSIPISATPVEQVEWKNGPGSSEPSCSAKSNQRRKKRARSSSPSSATRGVHSKHFTAGKDALDLESISRSLRTPKHEDPLALLWTHYAGMRGFEDGNDPTLPPLPPVSSSSPHTPGEVKKDNLRRTASCGVQWPTSSTKKRKLNDRELYSRAKGIFTARKDAILAKIATNQSRVSVLVDSIHQSLLQKATTESDAPSSSSPLPDRHTHLQYSPSKDIVPLHTILEQVEDPGKGTVADIVSPGQVTSSDFGDMDLDPDDPDLLDALQAATQRQMTPPKNPLSEQSLNPGVIDKQMVPPVFEGVERELARDQIVQDNKTTHSNAGHSTKPNAKSVNQQPEDYDSFDDEDGFATELVGLADMVDSQNVLQVDGANDYSKPRLVSGTVDAIVIDGSDDDFNENGEDDEIWAMIDDTTKRLPSDTMEKVVKNNHDSRTIKRYLVHNVFESHFKNAKGRSQPEKVISIRDEKLQQMYVVYLRQSWYDTRCTKGCFIHLIGDFDQYGNCIVDDENNMVILHPDHLISATTVADSFSCERRASLQDRIKATAPPEPPQIYGHLIHEVFGEALKRNRWDAASLRQIVEQLIPTHIEWLYEINVQIQDAIEYVMSKMPELTAWASIFVTGRLDPEATIRDRHGAVVPMAIDKLLEIEEHVWSPMYGLKGNIDATVQIQMQIPGERSSRTLTVPFELKTGKRDSNTMHRAQTALYTLLLSDRYDINVTSGILYYLETFKTFRVEGIRNEIKDMVIQRNKLACYVHDKLDLPPMVKRQQLCKKCFAQTSCFTYHKLLENGNGETSGMSELFTEAVGHLKESQQVFFKKWDDLLTKEERDAMRFKRELWTMLSTEREAVGRCFSNVIIEPGSATENFEAPKINRYTYSFVKQISNPGFSFTESQITIGEPIVISDEQGHFALANGFVTNVRPMRVTVAVDRRLQNVRRRQAGFDQEHNQVFSAITDFKPNSANSRASFSSEIPLSYRIDKDEFQNGMAVARSNILRIMEKDLWRARELRQLIIDLKPPAFKQAATAYTLSGPASQQDLNSDQRKAIDKVMSAKDYALVLGMPGTGKTTTIAHIIRALVLQGKSVLLTSYTHTAVDNILLKIKHDNIPILRLGAVGKVHPEVASFVDLAGIPKQTLADLEQSWTKSKVVATTCLGIGHAIFNHRKFDYCIVDEASQITLPVCLGPIRLASTFILVGDHYQLPPLVQNKEAQEGGLDISLFKLLSDAQPSSVVNLEHQYRMAEDIMLLSNTLIYDGRLKCGTSAVASRTLKIPDLSAGLEAHHYTSSALAHRVQPAQICVQNSKSCWLAHALNPLHRTLFLNTDTMTSTSALGAPETSAGHGTRITNHIEASLIAQLLTTLIRSGIPPKSIGVITFYRSQLALLKSTVKSLAGTSAANDVEMHTADKYQGRDKETILLSCVRSNDNHHVGELLRDWRRVNVALTRARSKLMIVGSLSTLGGSGVPVLDGLSQILMKNRWVLDLPEGARDMHHFEGMATQTQPRSRLVEAPAHKRIVTTEAEQSRDPKAQTKSDVRPVLASINGNTKAGKRTPAKIIRGGMTVEKYLDRHPLMKDVIDENMLDGVFDEDLVV